MSYVEPDAGRAWCMERSPEGVACDRANRHLGRHSFELEDAWSIKELVEGYVRARRALVRPGETYAELGGVLRVLAGIDPDAVGAVAEEVVDAPPPADRVVAELRALRVALRELHLDYRATAGGRAGVEPAPIE